MHVYSLGSPYGLRACQELAHSVKGQFHSETNPPKQPGPIAVWGQIRGAKELLDGHKDFYRLDHAYIGRNEYYRLTKGDFQPARIVERPADRWEALKARFKLEIEPWKKGENIVLAMSMPGTFDFFGVNPKDFTREIEKRTKRKVITRHRKESRPIKEDLKNAHCLVTWASNSVIEALLSGVPVIPMGPSIARPMATKIDDLEKPFYPENREEFFRHVAYSQFTLDEFKSGFAKKCADEAWDTVTVFSS